MPPTAPGRTPLVWRPRPARSPTEGPGGREGVRIYTDDAEALRRRVRESGQRGSATELLERTTPKPASVEERMRAASQRTKRFAEYARLKARHVAGLMSERLQKTRVIAVERWQAGRGQGDGSTPHMER